MKYCQRCGAMVEDYAIICTSCGASLTQDQTYQSTYTNPTGNNYNYQNNGTYYPNNQTGYTYPQYNYPAADAPSTGFAVLGFFIPIVGLILYLTMKDTTPLKAKSAGKGALIGFIVGFVSSILIWVIPSIFLVSHYY